MGERNCKEAGISIFTENLIEVIGKSKVKVPYMAVCRIIWDAQKLR